MRYRRLPACMLCVLALLFLLSSASAGETAWLTDSSIYHPGQALAIPFESDLSSVTIYLTDTDGRAIQTMPYELEDGKGTLTIPADFSADEGEYLLFLAGGSASSSLPLTVSTPFPEILFLDADWTLTDTWRAYVSVNTPGTLVFFSPLGQELARADITEDTQRVPWNGDLPESGDMEITARLIDHSGLISDPFSFDLTVPEKEPPHAARDIIVHTPSELSGVTCDHDVCFWKLQMGLVEENEENIWKVLTQPVTVLDGSERHQVKIRREPDADCREYTGSVTCLSQAVHVLQKGDTWTLIQAYSSSVEGSSVPVFAECFTGYVETSLLREKNVSQHVGVVVDKLTQRLHVFVDGHYYSSLLCSTGYARQDTPFNETPAGEFLAISHTGGFWAGDLYCDMAIRINDGILLHEVPCTITEEADGTKTRHYERCEYYLGEKASHGCIRIQRSLSPQRVNMKWLWDNLPRSGDRAKVIIWDDTGRTLGYPSDDFVLYYNPNNGRMYHSDPNCVQVNEKFWPLSSFSYSQLDEAPFASLTPCPGCTPQLRKTGIDTVNRKNDGHAY
ncbi:MAG: L,D-transpeptidase [Clostridia bacterium]|nr:L,D-transpeptidase [Clostridia bacterium]